MLFNKMKFNFPLGMWSDTTAPTVVITSTASNLIAAPFTCTFTFSEDVTGFAVGDITVSANASAGTFTAVSASVYTAIITPTSAGTVTVDVAAGVCADGAGNVNTAATQFSIVYGADSFTRSNGAIGGGWTGATWTIATNAAINTPTESVTELITNGTFPSDINGWTNSSQGTGSIAWNAAGKMDLTTGADSSNRGKASQQLTHAQYAWIAATQTMSNINVTGLYGNGVDSSSLGLAVPGSTTNKITFRAGAANLYYTIRNGVNNSTQTADDISAKQLTLTTLMATLPSCGVASVTANVLITVNPNSTQAGIIINLDSISSPANFVIAYHNGTNAILDKCVSGTYTNVISASATYGATNNLKVVKSGDSYSLYYGALGSETQIGTTQTISSMNGTIHGLFSTSTVAKFDNFSLSKT